MKTNWSWSPNGTQCGQQPGPGKVGVLKCRSIISAGVAKSDLRETQCLQLKSERRRSSGLNYSKK